MRREAAQKPIDLSKQRRPGVFSDARPRVVVTLSMRYLAQALPEQQPFWAQQPHWHWPLWQQPAEQVQDEPHLQPGQQLQEACDATAVGFEAVVRDFPAAVANGRGERWCEAAASAVHDGFAPRRGSRRQHDERGRVGVDVVAGDRGPVALDLAGERAEHVQRNGRAALVRTQPLERRGIGFGKA